MSVTITSRPNAFSALGNPTIYKFQRKDFLIINADNSAGLSRFYISGDVTASFHVDDIIYVGVTGYLQLAEVVSINTSGGNTLIVTTLAYNSGGGTSGYINNLTLKPLHHIAVNFYDASGLVLFSNLLFRFASDDSGLAIVDAQVIKLLLSDYTNTLLLGTATIQGGLKGIKFYIGYLETWQGGDAGGGQVSDSANPITGYLAAVQIPGTNDISAYVTDGATLKIFNTVITGKLTAWKGFTFFVSTLQTTTVNITMKSYVDGVNVDTKSVVGITGIEVGIDTDALSIGEHLLEVKSGSTVLFTRKFDVREPDCINPVLVFGRDSLGGIAQWLFEAGQQITVTNEDTYRHISMRCSASALTEEQFRQLYEAFSPASQIVDTDYQDMAAALGTQRHDTKDIFVVDKDGNKTQVVVRDFVAVRNTKANGHIFEFSIEMPYGQDI